MPKFGFIVTVMDTDARNAVRTLATGIFGKVTGSDTNGDGEPDRFVLTGVVPEVDVHVWAGWHPNVADNIRDRFFDLQFESLHQVAFFPPPTITRDYMIQRLKQFAMEHGCEKFWTVQSGSSLTTSSPADLLSRFIDP